MEIEPHNFLSEARQLLKLRQDGNGLFKGHESDYDGLPGGTF